MTTHSDARIEPYWFGRTEQEIRAAVEARGEAWGTVPGYSRYEWSDKGRLRRVRDGYIMKTGKLNNQGYVLPNVVNDDGKPVSRALAPMVLLAHHPAFRGLDRFPPGLETRHNPSVGDKTFNAYPEGIWPGTKAENNGLDKDPAEPLHPCKNAAARPGTVHGMNHNAGKRCVACLDAVGADAAELLRLGMPSLKVAARFGNSESWIMTLATKRGGYEGSNAEAREQRPSVGQRLRLARRLARMGDPL